MRAETLAEERREHYLKLDMGNLCGQPTNSPGGARATSLPCNVTCPVCKELLAVKGALETDVICVRDVHAEPVGRCAECDRFVCRCFEDGDS